MEHAEQPGDRDLVDLGPLSNIYEIWTTSGCMYGSDRVWRQLRRDGIGVGRKRVERLMGLARLTDRVDVVSGYPTEAGLLVEPGLVAGWA